MNKIKVTAEIHQPPRVAKPVAKVDDKVSKETRDV